MVKIQIMSLSKTKDYSKPKHVKTVYGGGKKQSEENINKSIRNIFIVKKNEAIKDRIIRNIRTLFVQENDYYNQKELVTFRKVITWNMKVVLIEIKTYQ